TKNFSCCQGIGGFFSFSANIPSWDEGNARVHALKAGVDGANGVYVYAPNRQFPSNPSTGQNYWVDVVFVAVGSAATTVTTVPTGLSITVDGVRYTTPQSFQWTIGSTHTIATTGTQPGSTGIQYLWNNWSDGGALSHSIVVPSSPTNYIA